MGSLNVIVISVSTGTFSPVGVVSIMVGGSVSDSPVGVVSVVAGGVGEVGEVGEVGGVVG